MQTLAVDISDREQLFVAAYVRYGCVLAYAANAVGITMKTAREWLKRSEIRESVKRVSEQIKDKLLADAIEIQLENAKIARSDIGEFAEWGSEDGQNYLRFVNSGDVDTSLVKKVSVTEKGASLELHSKTEALNQLGRALNIGGTEALPTIVIINDTKEAREELKRLRASKGGEGEQP